MIEEAYCSYEVAKLLKEKGFDENTSMVYTSYGDLCKCNRYNSIHNSNYNDITKNYFECTAPTQQMACDWVRKKGWHISIQLTYDENYNAVYYITISSTKTFLAEDIGELENKYFSKVEDATDESLKFVLTNLI